MKCKELEESNRMKKSKVLANKIRDIKGIFHARMDRIKDRNSKDLIEAEEIKKRWQGYTELYKVLMTQITTMVWSLTSLTHTVQPDILHCEISGP